MGEVREDGTSREAPDLPRHSATTLLAIRHRKADAGPTATGEREWCVICKWRGTLPIVPLSGEESAFIGRILMIKKLVEDKKLPCTYMTASLVHHLVAMNETFWAAVSGINDAANLRVCYLKGDSFCKKLLRR